MRTYTQKHQRVKTALKLKKGETVLNLELYEMKLIQ